MSETDKRVVDVANTPKRESNNNQIHNVIKQTTKPAPQNSTPTKSK